jgi:WhiB family redox-sensing transcriptional regulator
LKNIQLSIISSPFDGTQLCAEYDPDMFFPDTYVDNEVAIQAAKDVCNQCWLKNKCLDFAISTKEREGIWGGMTPGDRRRLVRKRRLDGKRHQQLKA